MYSCRTAWRPVLLCYCTSLLLCYSNCSLFAIWRYLHLYSAWAAPAPSPFLSYCVPATKKKKKRAPLPVIGRTITNKRILPKNESDTGSFSIYFFEEGSGRRGSPGRRQRWPTLHPLHRVPTSRGQRRRGPPQPSTLTNAAEHKAEAARAR